MYCRKCGASLPDNTSICPKCGVPQNQPSSSSPTKNNKNVVIALIIIGIAVLFLLGAIAYYNNVMNAVRRDVARTRRNYGIMLLIE